MKKLKAIDLYSGIGGWSLGLKLNGIEVIHSFEWWNQAVETANKNLGKSERTQDIREMSFSNLKKSKNRYRSWESALYSIFLF